MVTDNSLKKKKKKKKKKKTERKWREKKKKDCRVSGLLPSKRSMLFIYTNSFPMGNTLPKV